MLDLIKQQDYTQIWLNVRKFAQQQNLVFSMKPYRFEDITFETVTTKSGTYIKATATEDDCYLFSLGRRLLYNIGKKGEPLADPVVSDGLHLGVVMATVPMAMLEHWYNTHA